MAAFHRFGLKVDRRPIDRQAVTDGERLQISQLHTVMPAGRGIGGQAAIANPIQHGGLTDLTESRDIARGERLKYDCTSFAKIGVIADNYRLRDFDDL